MSNDNEIPIGSYIQNSIKGAWKLIQANPKSMDYFDLSSDGFWKSFWAIAVMAPAFALWAFYQLQGGPQTISEGVEISYPILADGVFFVIALPMTAFIMAYFTKFMKIDANYASMVIAYNWMSALVYLIMAVLSIILTSGIISMEITSIMLVVLRFYFGFYVVWFTLKTSLQITGLLALGVLIFVKLFETLAQFLLIKAFNPELFELMTAGFNSQPS